MFQTRRLESENIFEFSLKWQKGKGFDPSHNPSHSAYLEDLCQKFTSGLKRRIEDRAAFMSAMDGHRTYQEVLHHGAYCRSHASTCLVCKVWGKTLCIVCTICLLLSLSPPVSLPPLSPPLFPHSVPFCPLSFTRIVAPSLLEYSPILIVAWTNLLLCMAQLVVGRRPSWLLRPTG